jgi:2',3'-cyclic-nucleotide 2'-phosphodiesterase/3'-nucleotidase
MAAHGSLIANFFNQVQREASGAQLSATSLGNEVKGFDTDVTIRDVVATYIYPNTLVTLEVDRAVLKAVLERSADYFGRDESGALCVSDEFLKPKVEHYNYDYIAGVKVTMDLRRPRGDRVTSILYQGEELAEGRALTLCMNNYRATGTGGYDAYKTCPVVREQPTEIVELIMDYIETHRQITVDKTRWLTVVE